MQFQIPSSKSTNQPAKWTYSIWLEVDADKLLTFALLCKTFNILVPERTMTILTLLLSLLNMVKKYI